MQKFIPLKSYSNRIEADIAKQFLESHEIHCIVSADDAGGMRPDLLMVTGGAKLLCKEEDREKAISLLETT